MSWMGERGTEHSASIDENAGTAGKDMTTEETRQLRPGDSFVQTGWGSTFTGSSWIFDGSHVLVVAASCLGGGPGTLLLTSKPLRLIRAPEAHSTLLARYRDINSASGVTP